MQLLEILGDASDRLVGLAAQCARVRTELVLAGCNSLLHRITKTFMPAPDHGVYAAQKANSALDSSFGPAQLVLRRRGKEHKQPRGIGAKGSNHFIRIHSIAETLGHRSPIVCAFYSISDHALRQESLDRLLERNQTNIAHELGPEARVDQMHHGMRVP